MQSGPAFFVSSGDLIIDRRYGFARELEKRGDLAGAADVLAQAVERAPTFASAWFALGEVRLRLGDHAGAAEAFHAARAADPDDRQGAAIQLARLHGQAVEMPQAYLRALFDQYAAQFDFSLMEGLDYRAPALLCDAVQKAAESVRRPQRFKAMLDLGCGTGLAAARFRGQADRIVGVDLSPAMIEQARKKAIYDHLETGDLGSFLAAEGANGTTYDLVVAADVFMYLPDLAGIFAGASRVLSPLGLFAFTVETHDGTGVLLRDTLRYAHGEGYVRDTMKRAGLTALEVTQAVTRTEKNVPVPGLVAVAAASTPSRSPASSGP